MLAGCVSVTAPAGPGDEALSGRLSVRVDGGSGEPARTVSAGFELRGDAERGSLSLSTPLGTQLALAQWSPQQVLLVTPQGRTPYPDLSSLSRAMLGEELPVVALRDWLQGRPWPGAASSSARDDTGFEQLGWQVSPGRVAERSIVAHRIGPPEVTVKAVLDPP